MAHDPIVSIEAGSEEATSPDGTEWTAPVARFHSETAGRNAAAAMTPAHSDLTTIRPGQFESPAVPGRLPLYKVEHVGKLMRFSKLRHSWTLFLSNEAEEVKVELEHSKVSGKKKVLINGEVVFSTKERSLRWSWQDPRSKACITLFSENGNHSLRCEDGVSQLPGQGGTVHHQEKHTESAAMTWEVEDAETPPRRTRRHSGSRSANRALSRRRSASRGRDQHCPPPQAEAPVANGQEPPMEMAMTFPDQQERLASAQDDLSDGDVREEAKPSIPVHSLSFSMIEDVTLRTPIRGEDNADHIAETARLHALLSVRDAQIAALQSELRRNALGADEVNYFDPSEATQPVPSLQTQEVGAMEDDQQHNQSQNVQHLPKLETEEQLQPIHLLPQPQCLQEQLPAQELPSQQRRDSNADVQHFLVAQLNRNGSGLQAPIVIPPPRLSEQGKAETTSGSCKPSEPLSQKDDDWDDLDEEELNVTRRLGPVLQQGGSSSSTAAPVRIPFTPSVHRRDLVAVQVESVAQRHPRGRALSMEPFVGSPLLLPRADGPCMAGRPPRILSMPPMPRASSQTPHVVFREVLMTPGPGQCRSITPRRGNVAQAGNQVAQHLHSYGQPRPVMPVLAAGCAQMARPGPPHHLQSHQPVGPHGMQPGHLMPVPGWQSVPFSVQILPRPLRPLPPVMLLPIPQPGAAQIGPSPPSVWLRPPGPTLAQRPEAKAMQIAPLPGLPMGQPWNNLRPQMSL